jgi:hypothetical protein
MIHTAAHQHAFTTKFPNFSSFVGLGGNRTASRVVTEELKNLIHFTLWTGATLDVAMSWSFSNVNFGVEFIVQCLSIYNVKMMLITIMLYYANVVVQGNDMNLYLLKKIFPDRRVCNCSQFA